MFNWPLFNLIFVFTLLMKNQHCFQYFWTFVLLKKQWKGLRWPLFLFYYCIAGASTSSKLELINHCKSLKYLPYLFVNLFWNEFCKQPRNSWSISNLFVLHLFSLTKCFYYWLSRRQVCQKSKHLNNILLFNVFNLNFPLLKTSIFFF